jgi:hypothetical protein
MDAALSRSGPAGERSEPRRLLGPRRLRAGARVGGKNTDRHPLASFDFRAVRDNISACQGVTRTDTTLLSVHTTAVIGVSRPETGPTSSSYGDDGGGDCSPPATSCLLRTGRRPLAPPSYSSGVIAVISIPIRKSKVAIALRQQLLFGRSCLCSRADLPVERSRQRNAGSALVSQWTTMSAS